MTVRVKRRSVASIREAIYTGPIDYQIDALSALAGLSADHNMWVFTCTDCPALGFGLDWRQVVYGAMRHQYVDHRG